MRAGDSEGGKPGLKIWGHSSDIKSEVIKRCNTRCQQSCCYDGGVREGERDNTDLWSTVSCGLRIKCRCLIVLKFLLSLNPSDRSVRRRFYFSLSEHSHAVS